MRLEEFLERIADLITRNANIDQIDYKRWIIIAGMWHGLFNIARYGAYINQNILANKLLCLSRIVERLEYATLDELTKEYMVPKIASELREKLTGLRCINYVEPKDLDTLYEYAESYEKEFW